MPSKPVETAVQGMAMLQSELGGMAALRCGWCSPPLIKNGALMEQNAALSAERERLEAMAALQGPNVATEEECRPSL